MPNQGPLNKDLIAATLSIRGKMVIDRNRNIINVANVTATNLQVNDAITACEIQQKNINGIVVNGDIIMGNGFSITMGAGGNIVGDVCGNVATDNIVSKSGGAITVGSDVTVTGNVCGNIKTNNIVSKSGGAIAVGNDVTVTGNVNPTGVYKINGVQVVGEPLPDVANITPSSITGSADNDLQNVANTLVTDQSGNINNNFADLATKVNAILDVLRTHGLTVVIV